MRAGIRVALLAAPIAASADIVSPPAQRQCRIDDRVLAAGRAGQPGFHRLDRLPRAADYLAVYREVDHCPTPVIVRYDIGTGAATPRR